MVNAETLSRVTGDGPFFKAMTSTPVTIEDSDLPQSLLEDIVSRQLLESGVCDIQSLSLSTALGSRAGSTALRYSLTDGGRRYASEARARSAYTGPAPISESHYRQLIEKQSIHLHQLGGVPRVF